MNRVKILHTADLHIGAELSYLDNNYDTRRFEVLEVFRNITLKCRENNVEICLIAGDLFDSNAAAKQFISSVLQYIEDAKSTRFFLVCGNHDPLDASSPFLSAKIPENLTVFGSDYETVEIAELGVRIMGRSFAHSSMDSVTPDRMPDDNFINILLLHADFGATGPYNPINQQFVAAVSADYVALGHIHKRTEIQKLGTGYISYPGCPEGQGFDENGPKGVFMGELFKGGHELSFLKTSKRLHITEKVDLSSADNVLSAEEIILTHLKDKYGELFSENLYKLVLTGALDNPENIKPSHLELLLKEKLYFVKIKNETTLKLDLDSLSREPSLKGIFIKGMLEKLSSCTEDERPHIMDALNLGLAAFDSEVAYNED